MKRISKKTRAFDCVEIMHRAETKILKKLAGMTPEQELEYWRLRTEEMKAAVQRRQEFSGRSKHVC